MEKLEVFPSSVFIDSFLDEEARKMLREKVDYAEKNIKGIIVSNSNGWHSPKNVFKKFDSEFDEFYVSKIKTKLIECIREYYDDNEKILNHDNWDIEYWVNINRASGFNKSHDHSLDNHWSGVSYLTDMGDVKNSEGRLFVESKIVNSRGDYSWRIPQLIGKENKVDLPIEHVQNRIVIFPGTLWHRVEPVSSAVKERISIAFNAHNKFLTNGFEYKSKAEKIKNILRRDFRFAVVLSVATLRRIKNIF